jgi:hypothetical protein
MRFQLLFLCLFTINFSISAQYLKKDSIKNTIENPSEIITPNLLSTHPLGIYISRIYHNFKIQSDRKPSFSFDISNGNVWLPFVKSYELTDPIDQQKAEGIVWHEREFKFDLTKVPAKTKEFSADGVLRSYRLTFCLPVNINQELSISIRAYSLDKGKYPLSFITSDATIEWFHSNIKGGDDPFARRFYGLNKAGITYKDENDKFIKMNAGDFIIPGVELNYFYYPKLNINKTRNIYLNFGVHAGVNTSRVNPVTDIGISASILKKALIKNKNIFTVGLSTGALRQRVFQFGDRVDISNHVFLYSLEGLINYRKQLKEGRSISYGINYNLQTSYNKPSDFDQIVLTGIRKSTQWHYAFSHLYRNVQGWSFIFTHTNKRFSYYLSLREDLKVDNAPDIQTGAGVKVSLK